ncbi:hypothetical protein AYR46_03905 [Sphingobium yanoikuyae]|nr:hypothetical protein AYR46_03905 [Sphingobium yanoikuyae]
MPRPSTKHATPKPEARTRVGNGSVVLQGVDARSITFRRYREILASLIADMGGDPTEAQSQIARRAASLSIWCEDQDTAAANGTPIDIGAYTTASNSLRRLLESLGLERKQRNVTPTIAEYAAQKAAEKARAA